MRALTPTAALILCLLPCVAEAQIKEWPAYGGDPGGTKYSAARQIDRGNVARLQPAWIWKTGEEPNPGWDVAPGRFQATPLMINDTLYLTTSYHRVVALDARTGRELWSYDPRSIEWGPASWVHRGAAAWTDGTERRIFFQTRWRLIALDARTGKPVPSFGTGGEVDVSATLPRRVFRLHYQNTSPPVVYDDLVIVGSSVGDDFVYEGDPPGNLQAFDARTGELVWQFNPIPRPGEPGNDTWEDGSWVYSGHTNVWAPFTLDERRGLLYLPVSTPSNDAYGGHRKGDNLFAESVVCLDARTGERVWHFQTVHHGIWDYDLPSPPNLATIRVDGRAIDAVAVAAKTGFVFVFDRVTGEPVWPIEERPVPASDVPGERASPTQPFPTNPAPFAVQGFTGDDVVDFTPALRAMALEALAAYRSGPLFTPPATGGTILMPGVNGGANWGGAALDPETGVLFVRANNWPTVYVIDPFPDEESGFQHIGRKIRLSVADGVPVNKPPYTTLTAIDLNTGEHRWQIPIGDTPELRTHPMLHGVDLPPALGVARSWAVNARNSGPLATAGGLVFVSGGDTKLYAVDADTGAVLWAGDLGGRRGTANPMTYQTASGRQFVVIATSTTQGADGTLMAFALGE